MSISPVTAVGQSRRTNKPDDLAGCPLHPQLHEICATRQNEFNVNSEREKSVFAYSALMFAALIIGHHFSISFL
jgi:hypothetical protein